MGKGVWGNSVSTHDETLPIHLQEPTYQELSALCTLAESAENVGPACEPISQHFLTLAHCPLQVLYTPQTSLKGLEMSN